jgi:hypothetical protein
MAFPGTTLDFGYALTVSEWHSRKDTDLSKKRSRTKVLRARSLGLTRRAYARQRGVSEGAIRKHLASGLLAPALLADGSLDPARADALLARQRTRGVVSAALSEARRRKLAAQVALLADEIAQRQENLCRRDEVDEAIRAILREIARGLRPILDGIPELAGADARTAFAVLTDSVHTTLQALSEAEIVSTEVAESQPVQGLAICDLDAVQLAARKAELEALRLELARAQARGELIPNADVEWSLIRRLANARTVLLALPSRLAPLFPIFTPQAAEAAVRRALEDAISNLAGEDVAAGELKEALNR